MLSPSDYTVAVVCAMEFEMSAVRYMLDHEDVDPILPTDEQNYVLGTLSGHKVVLAWLPGIQGKAYAATVATNLERTFPSIKWRFLVGIGGGVTKKHDIRLGDVVVSMPDGQYNGLVQYDLGKETTAGFVTKGSLQHSPSVLRSAIERMKSDHRAHENKIDEFISAMLQRGKDLAKYRRPTTESDVLFEENYPHASTGASCKSCDISKAVERDPRESDLPEIHYGLIASGDSVIKDTAKKNEILSRCGGDILCFEMEAAGMATEFPSIVIRGISDYADSHKSDGWQLYAAAAAAACCKELLSIARPRRSTSAPSDKGTGSDGHSVFIGRGVQHSGSGNMSLGNLNFG
ncbi:hypothetical protein Hte_005331 [Hypoxylon texense]